MIKGRDTADPAVLMLCYILSFGFTIFIYNITKANDS
jgi:hypothetical protein